MKTLQAIEHYGTQQRLADALGVKQSNVSKWLKKGIPYLRQLQIQVLTKGKLKAEKDLTTHAQKNSCEIAKHKMCLSPVTDLGVNHV